MRVGVGYANNMQSYESGIAVAKDATKKGNIKKPVLAIAFCAPSIDHEEYMRGIRDIVGDDMPIIGGTAVGVITNDALSYEGSPCALVLFESNSLEYAIEWVSDIDHDEHEAGRQLGVKLQPYIDYCICLLFYDSVKRKSDPDAPPQINASPLLISGIEEKFTSPVPLFGAGFIGGFDMKPSRSFCTNSVEDSSAVAALLKGNFSVHSSIMHGCTPLDGIFHTITKMEGPVLYEIDGIPVVKLLDDTYGNKSWRDERPVRDVSIGINYGKKFSDFNDEEYVNRLIISPTPDEKGVVLFEPDMTEGTEIQFMLRDIGEILDTTKRNTKRLMDRIISENKKPVFAFYIDCAGRCMYVSNTLSEEAEEVQKVCNKYDVPLVGFYSGVEIAPMLGKARGLDWTGVLVVFSVDE